MLVMPAMSRVTFLCGLSGRVHEVRGGEKGGVKGGVCTRAGGTSTLGMPSMMEGQAGPCAREKQL